MRQPLLCVILAGLLSSAHSQPSVLPPVHGVQNMSDERSLIDAERRQSEAEFGEQVMLCYAKFAVNDCLAQARRKQRLVLNTLRQREVALSNVAREQKVQAQLARLQSNASSRHKEDGLPRP
jgi:hypothetical protein